MCEDGCLNEIENLVIRKGDSDLQRDTVAKKCSQEKMVELTGSCNQGVSDSSA